MINKSLALKNDLNLALREESNMPKLACNLECQYNHRLDGMSKSGIREFDEKISGIPDIIKLTIGEPDLNTPDHVKDAAISAINANESHYAPQLGMFELRKAIANFLKRTQDLEYSPENEILVTNGATEAIAATMFALLNKGDKVILPTPGYALYFPIVKFVGAEVVPVDVSKTNFELTPSLLEKTLENEGAGAKMVILNYPTNPTGKEYNSENIKELAKVIKKNNLYVLADEIYKTLIYDDAEHYSIANEIPDRTILISGVSKSHAMTGYRIGYIAAPAPIIKLALRVHGYLVTSISSPMQLAAAEALNNGDDDPKEMQKIYNRRRSFIIEKLNEMEMNAISPEGAFYIFIHIPDQYGSDDVKFCEDLARKARVGVTPGSLFGPGGEGYFRVSYATSDENLAEAMDRMNDFISSLA